MTAFRAVAWLLVALFAAPATAADFADAPAYIATIANAMPDQSMVAKGDLDADGRDELAIVTTAGPDFASRTRQLHVLLQRADGRYALAVSSPATGIPGMGCCWTEALEITNGSLYVQDSAKTACDIEGATHQFKWYRGQWRLLGVKIVYVEHCEDVIDTRDTNVLTGKTIHTRQVGDGPEQVDTTVGKTRVVLLADFDFFNGFGLHDE